MSSIHQRFNRRQFLQTAACASTAPLIVPAAALGRDGRAAASERVTLGVVGLGGRGFALLNEFLKHADAQVVAVCDVDSEHYRDRPWGKGNQYGRESARERVKEAYAKTKSGTKAGGVQVYSDYRELCARKDIDAVVVATPDHWHALCALEALRHGKDVYGEKPVTHLFHEGQVLYREVAQRKAVFQTGSQQRSDPLFRQAVELVINGHIGKVKEVQVGLPPGYDSPQSDATVKSPPEHLDYDMWTGPAPMLPYMRARNHRLWRGHRAYGGGVLMDWIGHHNDIAHWALGEDTGGPVKVEAVDWAFPDTDVYDTPQQYEIRCEYATGVTTTISTRNRMGTRWIGEDGWVYVTRGRLTASDVRWTKPNFNRGSKTVYNSPGHTRNFLDCVRSRKACIAPAETAHRSITPGHLGYVSNALGRAIKWDAKQERVVGDDEANTLLRGVSYREPWVLG